jgi:NDP-sugar pyrophosphorylase family protein
MLKSDSGPVHIIGAGGLGRDLVACFGKHVSFAAFWDDQSKEKSISGIPFGGTVGDLLSVQDPVRFVIAVGNPAVREKLWQRLLGSHHTPALLIHPEARLFDTGTISAGAGTILFPQSLLTTGIAIGENTVIHAGCSLHHDTRIGSHCVIMPHVVMAGNVTTGNGVYVSPGKTFFFGEVIGDEVRV